MKKDTNYITFNESFDCKNLTAILNTIRLINYKFSEVSTEDEVIEILLSHFASIFPLALCEIYVQSSTSRGKSYHQFSSSKEVEAIQKALHTEQLIETLINPQSQEQEFYLNNDRKIQHTTQKTVSQLIIPISTNQLNYGYLNCVAFEQHFFNENSRSTLEIILSSFCEKITNIRQKEQSELLQSKLKKLFEQQKKNLIASTDKVSFQSIQIEAQKKKQAVLMQEIHHRVTNNLQIIVSILRLYKNEGNQQENQILEEVQNKVEVMALIYQNIYKSIEINKVNVISYFSDLSNYLSYSIEGIQIQFINEIEFDYLDLETLVSVGLFVTEIFYMWVNCGKAHHLDSINIHLTFKMIEKGRSFQLTLHDNLEYDATNKANNEHETGIVNQILIAALIDQLGAEFSKGYEKGNFIQLDFITEN